MKLKTFEKIKKDVENIYNSGKTVQDYFGSDSNRNGYISNKIGEIKNDPEKYPDADYVINMYSEIVKRRAAAISAKRAAKSVKTSGLDAERASVDLIRDDNGKIIRYDFTVYVRDKQPLKGSLSRDEMSMVYRMYSAYGSRLTQREVSRTFPEYSLMDFKRVLRAFGITKASSPFPPHMVEEHTKEELLDIQFREKENDFLRSYENEKVRQCENALKDKTIENHQLRQRLEDIPNFLKDVNVEDIISSISPRVTVARTTNKKLILWLSDMHIGAHVSSFADYDNTYNEAEAFERLDLVMNSLAALDVNPSEVIICDLGDALDGMDNKTCRRDHLLVQNMDNKEQFTAYIRLMTKFFASLREVFPSSTYKYYSVGDSNHGGSFEWAAKYALAQILDVSGVDTEIFDTFLGNFSVDNHTFVITHGKDARDMKSGMPLALNDKTINYLTTYILENNLSREDITVVKGDLHTPATTFCNLFKYRSVGSLFGGSEWCQKNFGPTKARCDYSVLVGDSILDGTINLQ